MKILSDDDLRQMAAFTGWDVDVLRAEYQRFVAKRRTPDAAPAARPKFWLTDEEGDAAANAHLQTPCPCGVGVMP